MLGKTIWDQTHKPMQLQNYRAIIFCGLAHREHHVCFCRNAWQRASYTCLTVRTHVVHAPPLLSLPYLLSFFSFTQPTRALPAPFYVARNRALLAQEHAPPLSSTMPLPPRLLVDALSIPQLPESHPSLSPALFLPAMTSACLYAIGLGATTAASGEESTPPSLPTLSSLALSPPCI
jgi:hypothetical protein